MRGNNVACSECGTETHQGRILNLCRNCLVQWVAAQIHEWITEGGHPIRQADLQSRFDEIYPGRTQRIKKSVYDQVARSNSLKRSSWSHGLVWDKS